MTNLTNDVPVTDEQHPLEAALDGLGLVLTDDPDFDHDEQTFGRAMDTALSRLTSQPVTGDLVEKVAAQVHDAMVWAAGCGGTPQQWQGGNSTAEGMAREYAKEILSAAQQGQGEPVVWRYQFKDEEPVFMSRKKDWAVNHPDWTETPLYARPHGENA